MRELKKLIKELCPEGVEYKKLSEITNLTAGERITKAMMSDDMQYPVYGGGVAPTGMYSKSNFQHAITISRAGSAGHVNWVENKFWATDVCFVATQKTNDVNIKFVYYVVKNLQPKLQQNIYGGNLPKLNKDFLWSLPIPVPPIQIQEKIVSILDKMSELAAELAAELAMRKEQYRHYCDSAFVFDNSIPMVKLGEFAEITRGGNFQKKDFVDSGCPCIHYGQMYTHFGVHTNKTLKFVNKKTFNKSKQAVPNDIIMAVTSENVEDVCSCTAWVGKENIAVSGHTAIIHHNQNAKYLSYYFHTSHFFSQKKKLAHGIKVIEVTPSKLSDIEIPLPSIEVQEMVVAILDRFNSICNDIYIGLPAEIELRQKQYEYYRNKLLAFKELKKEDTNE